MIAVRLVRVSAFDKFGNRSAGLDICIPHDGVALTPTRCRGGKGKVLNQRYALSGSYDWCIRQILYVGINVSH